jgi:Rrf2 family protein
MAIGQFFSQRFGYAVHAMAFIAKKPAGELATLPEVAEWMRSIWPSASESYLSNVVQRLARARILRSHRGISGGYSLARAATKITLRDLVELLEGVDQDRCGLSLEDHCPVKAHCSIQQRLRRLEDAYLKSLEEVTIADLAQDIVVQRPSRERV